MAGMLLSIGYVAVLLFIITSMVVMGLNVTIRDLIAPMKNKKLILMTLLANFILVPILAFIIIFFLPINKEMAAGLILVSIAAGAPSTPKVAELTGGNISYAVATTIVMTILTIILMPLLLPYLLEGTTMDPTKVAVNLVVLMLIPLLIGMGVRYYKENFAKKSIPILFWISNGCIGIIFLVFGFLLFSRIGELFGGSTGSGMVLAAILFTIGSLLIGYFLGGSSDTKGVLAFGTGFRNVTAALVVIAASFAETSNDTLLMVLMVTLVSVILVSVIVGLILKKRIDQGKGFGPIS